MSVCVDEDDARQATYVGRDVIWQRVDVSRELDLLTNPAETERRVSSYISLRSYGERRKLTGRGR